MKTEFELEYSDNIHCGYIRILRKDKNSSIPYVMILTAGKNPMFIQDKDLERFAVNILKALDSDHIKPLWARNSSWGKTKTGRLKKSKKLK